MEPKEIPADTSWRALFRPNLEHAYLRDAERVPLVLEPGFRTDLAWWCAEVSLLAYVRDPRFVAERLAAAGRPGELVERGSSAFVISGELVAFRGTDELSDALLDLDVRLSPEGAGEVHRGFQRALEPVWPELVARLDGRPGWFCGHSLGGAMAVLAAARLPAARAVYTFGAPRIGTSGFVAGLSTPVHRFVNNSDLVACLPPPVRFAHVGELRYFDALGKLRADSSAGERAWERVLGHARRLRSNWERWREGDPGGLSYASLIDHSPLHYALRVWNHHVARSGGLGDS